MSNIFTVCRFLVTSINDWNNIKIHFFMFCWTCISIHQRNKYHLDALFIISLFRQSTSTRFGHICSPSSGSILYIYTNSTCCAFQLTVCWPGWEGTGDWKTCLKIQKPQPPGTLWAKQYACTGTALPLLHMQYVKIYLLKSVTTYGSTVAF